MKLQDYIKAVEDKLAKVKVDLEMKEQEVVKSLHDEIKALEGGFHFPTLAEIKEKIFGKSDSTPPTPPTA